jgi:hypothetical protein
MEVYSTDVFAYAHGVYSSYWRYQSSQEDEQQTVHTCHANKTRNPDLSPPLPREASLHHARNNHVLSHVLSALLVLMAS